MAQLRFFDADRRLAQLSAKGDPLEAIDKRFQITLGTRNRKILEQVSAGVHDGDHHACKRFPKQNSRCHCHERDRIDADPALGKISNDRKAEASDDRHRARGPHPGRKTCAAVEPNG